MLRRRIKGEAVAVNSEEQRANSLTLFDKRDKDKDNRVTLEEFLAGRTGDTVPTLTRRFKELDRNGDGAWTKDEIAAPSQSKDVSK